MNAQHVAKMIQQQDPRCKWIGSWSNYYSVWAVDGTPYIYSKTHRTAEDWREHPNKEFSLFHGKLKTKTTDPKLAALLSEIEQVATGYARQPLPEPPKE